jgi:hypothetical protein
MLTYTQSAPIPHGHSIVSCKKLLWRLKKQYSGEMENIKNSQPIGTGVEGDTAATSDKKTA